MRINPSAGYVPAKRITFSQKNSKIHNNLPSARNSAMTKNASIYPNSQAWLAMQCSRVQFSGYKVPKVDEPLYQWVDGNSDGTRLRKALPKGLGMQHRGFADGPNESSMQGQHVYDNYFLVDPTVSEPLIINKQAKLSAENIQSVLQQCDQMGIFNVPLYNPRKSAQNVGEYRVPWLREQYSVQELEAAMAKPINERDNQVISSIPSVGAHFKMTYSNWWLRDSEAAAYAFTHSQHPNAEIRKKEHNLGAKLTLSNLAHYVSRYSNIAQIRFDAESDRMIVEGPIKALIDDETRDRIRGGHWPDHTIHIKDQATGERLNHPWPQLQFDALGLHLAAVSTHLAENDCIKWNALSDQEKEALTILYADLLRLKYWDTPDSGAWEFDPDGKLIRSSSVGMATNGMLQLQKLLFAPDDSGKPIREWMQNYLETMVKPLAPQEKQEAFQQELIAPLLDKEAFERQAVAPGFRRLYHQLPCEGFFGIDTNRLDDAGNLYKPYHPENNKAMWDSATLFIPRYAPELLERMDTMKERYFPQDDVGDALREIRNRYARGVNAEPVEADRQQENSSFLKQILNSNQHNLWRRSGIARYFEDEYQNLEKQPNKPRPFNGKRNLEPEWTNFPPMHASLWFNQYLKTQQDADFMRGLDAWNLSMSSLSKFRDIRDGSIKVKWMESVRPYPAQADEHKIQTCMIPDLAWSHAEAKAMGQAFQLAAKQYLELHPTNDH